MAARPSLQRFVAEPVHQPAYERLSLAQLRSIRAELREEEARVSYWRRIVQARVDLARAPRTPDGRLTTVSRALAATLGSDFDLDDLPSPRSVSPDERLHPLPRLTDLAALWERVGGDDELDEETLAELDTVERELSEFRHELHRRLTGATSELMARYHEDPTLCLSALPLAPAGTTPATR
jgi:hypothetical protein